MGGGIVAWLCGLLVLVVLLLALKIHTLRKAARELRAGLAEKLSDDTNTLLSLSSGDRELRALAADLNRELRTLRDLRRRYQLGDAQVKEAVTNLSHDLRTPLTAICGYLELLEKSEKSPEAERYLAVIAERAETLRVLTEELFRYAIASSAEPVCTRIDLRRALEESLAAHYAVLTRCGITPRVQLPECPVERMLDPTLLARIFGNLLGNAAKYSGGDLEIVLTESSALTLSNSAPALDAVQAGRLFERYYTVESGQSSTGLGLSIARTLMQQLGGEISAKYEDGRLCVSLLFPE